MPWVEDVNVHVSQEVVKDTWVSLSMCTVTCFWTGIKMIFCKLSLETLMTIQYIFTVVLCWSSRRRRFVTLRVCINGRLLPATEERAFSTCLLGIMGMYINKLNIVSERTILLTFGGGVTCQLFAILSKPYTNHFCWNSERMWFQPCYT